MAQISINDKTEETELLKEYIIMEREKLDEGRKTFQEDTEKYEKFKMDLQARSQKTEDEVRKVQKEIERLQSVINEYKKQEAQLISEDSKFLEELQGHKQHKRFLDLLAIGAKLKRPVNQKQRKAQKAQMNELSAEQMQNLESGQRFAKQHGDATFMTSVQNQGLQSQKTSKGIRSKKEFSEDQLGNTAGAEREETPVQEESYLDGSDIDLNASYSDSDKEVPFKQSKEVIEYLFDLER